jgi:hypothetical protein
MEILKNCMGVYIDRMKGIGHDQSYQSLDLQKFEKPEMDITPTKYGPVSIDPHSKSGSNLFSCRMDTESDVDGL